MSDCQDISQNTSERPEITAWLILAKESRFFCKDCPKLRKNGKMLENVNCRKRNGRFLCEDEIHRRDVSRNAENMTQLVLFWRISPDFPMSCWLNRDILTQLVQSEGESGRSRHRPWHHHRPESRPVIYMHETVAAPDIVIPNHHIQSQTRPDIYLHIETHTFAPDPFYWSQDAVR